MTFEYARTPLDSDGREGLFFVAHLQLFLIGFKFLQMIIKLNTNPCLPSFQIHILLSYHFHNLQLHLALNRNYQEN